jgi:hypothetical protein
MAASIAWLTNVVDTMNFVMKPSKEVWLPALPHRASSEG